MSHREIDYNKLDKEVLMELGLEDEVAGVKFQKIGGKKRKFDDGTFATKTGKKKEKVQRGGKDELEIPEDEE